MLRSTLNVMLIMAIAVSILPNVALSAMPTQARAAVTSGSAAGSTIGGHPRVLIELFVMSRCPDARRAEARFNEVLAQTYSIADIRTIYIADEDTPANVTCKHGPVECAGNTQQLCAARHGRRVGISQGWTFLACQNTQFEDVGSPELADTCLQTAGFSGPRAERVRSCWSGWEGARLLSVSAREARRRGVGKSCTIYIGGLYRCTHDNATWYDCPGGSETADFVASICSRFQQLTGRWPKDVCGPQPEEALEGQEAQEAD